MLPFLLVALVAQQTTPDWNPYASLTQIGIGALVAAPFIYVWRQAEKRATECEKRCADLQLAALRREREIGDGTTALLADAAEALRDTQKGMDAVVERVKSPSAELDIVLRRLELVTDEMRDDRRRRRGPGEAEPGG